ncbi:MAG: YbjN domain-containing protein [Micrococcales bacterium]|nr:YbjN domain-containing protein [Micrococcales bacterium]
MRVPSWWEQWRDRVGVPARPPVHPPGLLPTGVGAPTLDPVDRDRIADCLSARGYQFVVDADGDLTGTWNTHQFWFLLLGDHADVVQVRGRWARTLSVRQRRPALLALNDWNRERIWPKSYLREENHRIAVYAEVSVALEAGATNAQLDQVLTCGLGTGVQLFKALDNQVPPDED